MVMSKLAHHFEGILLNQYPVNLLNNVNDTGVRSKPFIEKKEGELEPAVPTC
jgi:hypothetical protein